MWPLVFEINPKTLLKTDNTTKIIKSPKNTQKKTVLFSIFTRGVLAPLPSLGTLFKLIYFCSFVILRVPQNPRFGALKCCYQWGYLFFDDFAEKVLKKSFPKRLRCFSLEFSWIFNQNKSGKKWNGLQISTLLVFEKNKNGNYWNLMIRCQIIWHIIWHKITMIWHDVK